MSSCKLDGAELTLLHVRDTHARDFMDLTRRRRAGPPLPPRRGDALNTAEAARAEAALAQARNTLLSLVPDLTLRDEVRSGQPEREIVDHLVQAQADLVVLGARPGVTPGPHSIGHIARYVLDHAPCSALIVRANNH